MKKHFIRKALALCVVSVMVSLLSLQGCNNKDVPASTTVKNGLSAYELAVEYGYEGTVQEWLDSLNGKSAYEIAKDNGYTGTEKDWTASLEATAGKDGVGIKTAAFSESNELLITLSDGTVLNLGVAKGIDGTDGKDGQNGADGANGTNGKDGIGITAANINADGQLVIAFSDGNTVNLDKVVGMNGTDGIGISSSVINTDGELVITYTNGQTANLGVVVGAKGDKGDTGAQGEQGIQGIQGEKGDKGDTGAAGQDGNDGVSVTKTEINQRGELVITLSDNTVSNLGVVVGAKGDKGDKGEKGATGAQGEQGIQGIQGETGAKGDDGVGIETIVIESGNLKITLTNDTTLDLGNIKGEKGETGATGATGDKGDKGEQGIQGIQGVQGEKGEKGDTGAAGQDGVGVSSVQLINNELIITLSDTTVINLGNVKGDKGDKGDTGATGATGADGIGIDSVKIENGNLFIKYTNIQDFIDLGNIKGADGAGIAEVYVQEGYLYVRKTDETTAARLAYIKGEKGDKGDTGAQGTAGADGVDGESAYQLYKNAHPEYTGSMDEWLASLKGEQGPKGEKGDKGDSGRGIYELQYNDAGELIVVYTDDTTQNLGVLKNDDYVTQNQLNFLYKLLDDGTYEIVGLTDNGSLLSELAIPSKINGIAVTSIGEEAFASKRSLTKVEIPNGVISIKSKAFYYCDAIESLVIPDSVKYIGESAFAFMKKGIVDMGDISKWKITSCDLTKLKYAYSSTWYEYVWSIDDSADDYLLDWELSRFEDSAAVVSGTLSIYDSTVGPYTVSGTRERVDIKNCIFEKIESN